jgi:transposase
MEVPSRFEIDDALWAEIVPLSPVRQRRRRYPGRKAIGDRLVLSGILHVLHTGIAWEDLPRGVRRRIRGDVLAQAAGLAGRRRMGCRAPAPSGQAQCRRCDRLVARERRRFPYPCAFGGSFTGPSPDDRARNGSKHHLLVDQACIPLAVALTAGNRNDITQLIALLEQLHARPVKANQGRPRQGPERLLADRADDHDNHRRLLRAREHHTRHRPPRGTATARGREPSA